MSTTRLTVEQWQAMFPPDRQRFLAANELMDEPFDVQETHWQDHLKGLQWFFEKCAILDAIVIPAKEP